MYPCLPITLCFYFIKTLYDTFDASSDTSLDKYIVFSPVLAKECSNRNKENNFKLFSFYEKRPVTMDWNFYKQESGKYMYEFKCICMFKIIFVFVFHPLIFSIVFISFV